MGRLAWIHHELWQQLLSEAERAYPQETGGVLMGYWAKRYSEVVITTAIGPGPQAQHRQQSFVPDSEFHEAEIARIYHESHRLLTYLGDWHTHPAGSSYLSWRDKRTLSRIAACRESRCPAPIMAVMGEGSNRDWVIRVWKYKRQRVPMRLFRSGVEDLSPLIYQG
jgi:integrative and conjugative element protein (TIGR02256 family)